MELAPKSKCDKKWMLHWWVCA